MENLLWHRLTSAARAEVDTLIANGRTIQAIAVMRDHAEPPTPDLRECVDLLALRHEALHDGDAGPGNAG
ncbi:hypothetical protein CTZ27_14600 [Streptomyces griseocarneus]|nr:hypothetical protein CTZ27_14600 [Streptomyces griseocarneus]